MTIFCFLFIPIIYLFQRSLKDSNSSGGVWALLLGSIFAIIRFFMGDMINPGGFGLSRFLSAFIDIVSLPVLTPIIVFLLLINLRLIQGNIDFANFSLLWLIPEAALRAISWSSVSDPILLVIVPILWASIAIGLSFFISLIQDTSVLIIILLSLAILLVPFAAAASYWAFFSQQTLMGFLLLLAAAAPMLVCLVLSFIRAAD